MVRILVIDDDEEVLTSVRKVLEREGYEVTGASNGKVALGILQETPPDLILSDLYMPEMDGMEMLIRLKAKSPETRVVVMSGGGYQDKESLLDIAATLGAEKTLPKPFTAEQLLEVIHACLD